MNEQDLDRVIDQAAADLVEREPTRALTGAVMARIAAPEPAGIHRFVWATAASLLLCGVIAALVLNRTPPPADHVGSPAPPAAQAVLEAAPTTVRQDAPEAVAAISAGLPSDRRAPAVTSPPGGLLFGMEPIATAPLVLPAIELPPLAQEAAAVPGIEIGALAIEPLTASND